MKRRMGSYSGAGAVREADRNLQVVAKGAGISFFGAWIGQGAIFLSGLVVARTLGPDDYGLYALGITVVSTLWGLSLLGLPWAVQRYVALYRGEGDAGKARGSMVTSLVISGLVGSLMGLLLVAFAPFAAQNVFHNPEMTSVLRLLAVVVPFLPITDVMLSGTLAFQTTKYAVFVRNIFAPWCKLALFSILLALGWRLWGAVAAYVIAVVLAFGFAAYYLNRLFPLFRGAVKAVYQPRVLLAFSLPVSATSVVITLQSQADIYFLSFFSAAGDVGVYKVGVLLAALVPGALVSLNSIFSPMISDLHHRGQLEELERLFQSISRWSLAASLPIFLVLLLYGGPVLSIFGPAFAAGAVSLAVLSAGQLVNAATGPVGFMISMTGRPKVNLANEVLTLVVTVALGLLLIPRLGLVGAAAAAAAAQATANLMRLWQVHLLLRMRPNGRGVWKPLASALAAGAASYAVSTYLFLGTGLGMLAVNLFFLLGVYVLALWLLGLEREDLMVATALRRKLAGAVAYR